MAEPVTLADLKLFARIDDDAEDALITSLGATAREYIEQATGHTFDETAPERAKLAIKSLTAFWYESRTPLGTIPENGPPLPMHVRSLIHQITDWTKLGEPEPTP
ncbi:phage gp6-like head-tail connector protein [Nitratireductor aquimarinus]|uniref:head-tail connector protein n=1 Tax=Nitratireductor TaxID=245876 RepID=UPI0019D3CC33|nr:MULTISPECIES: head-tail connector protein [Nitratireductor]MBN7776715.1 phage gp6-like head-tail connector protein [Nitratireductor pacificus]MBN7780049.1 phage gp6-like head-tail connector protein [Nitratireductor pacificus]MBN7788856.1 phage gp6-like head-tail connector protein [Nitratireductor aquimarinus]MBY6098924.1 head-tail connector protein [Nitratireductor aquimarinus]MCA1259416.1 head-tail connector protein [Nitratireductor aquimarinus]